jgi:hypothetical protein
MKPIQFQPRKKVTLYKDHAEYSDKNISFDELMNIYGNAILALLKSTYAANPKSLELIYSTADVLFSNILINLDPDHERYPDFTVKAMDYAMQLLADKEISEIPAERKVQIEAALQQLIEAQKAKVTIPAPDDSIVLPHENTEDDNG